MQTLQDLKNRTRHDAMLAGDNKSYLVAGRYPCDQLKAILPRAMSIPSAEVMAQRFPTVRSIEGTHPFLLMFSNCFGVHDVMTEIELRPYRELMFFIPVTYTHNSDEHLCSYVPVLYLEYLLGVIGGLYLGLRKEFHPKMQDVETDTSKSFHIEGILDASFEKSPPSGSPATGDGVLDPFFTQVLDNPTVTVSYLNRTRFYTTTVHADVVLDASARFEWRYKGSLIMNDAETFANYAEYHFTTSQAMSHGAYFHPSYPVR